MTHLNIQQGLNIEVVSTNLIKKLYEAALSVPEPLEGELDAAYMSGNLLVGRAYRALVEYLTNRFDDLHINVTDSYYIPFEDSAVLSALLANNIGDGVGITESNALAVTNMSLLGLTGNSNITSFTELREFKNITTGSTDYFAGCTNLEWIALPENNNDIGISYYISGGKTLKWVVPSIEFVCSKNFGSWYNNPGRGGGADHVWTPYDLNKQPITDVVIPDGVTTIGKYVFSKMSCDSITIPTSITDIKRCAFENTLIVSPAVLSLPHLTSLGNNAFLNCTGITSIDFTGSTFTTVGASTFRGCSNLTKLVLPTTVTTIGNEWVVDIPRLITVEGTDNIANYGSANHYFRNPIITNPLKTGFVSDRGSLFMVHGNSANTGMSLHSLYEPLRKNTPVGSFILASNNKISLFWSSSSNSANANIGLYYLKDIETFGYMTFYGTTIDNLVINNVTPPTLTTTENSTLMGYTMYQNWGNVIFGPNSVIGTLWVPDSAVATYQADPLYSGLTIKGINTKTNGVDYDLPRYATYADWKTAEAAAVAQGGHAPQGLIEAWM